MRHIKPNYHIEAQSDENDINKICKTGFHRRQALSQWSAILRLQSTYPAHIPTSNGVYTFPSAGGYRRRNFCCYPNRSNNDPPPPTDTLCDIPHSANTKAKKRKSQYSGHPDQGKSYVSYSLPRLPHCRRRYFVFNFDICDMQARGSPVHRRCITGRICMNPRCPPTYSPPQPSRLIALYLKTSTIMLSSAVE